MDRAYAKQIVAFSGGKDSTALILRMAELGEKFECLFTPTGNELPDLAPHMKRILEMAGSPVLHLPTGPTLTSLIEGFGALPNWRQRWCTRMIKIVPCNAFLRSFDVTPILVVGLRADEEDRGGIYGDFATYRYPLREWGWGIEELRAYLKTRGVTIPRRTDCALCYGQRLGEWWRLWKEHPAEYARGEFYEEQTGHTFRSPQRDSWPAPLIELRKAFESGRRPRGEDEDDDGACRVCSL